MTKITLKIGLIILSISLVLLIVEIFGTMILGVAFMGESGGLYIFNFIYFIIASTAAVGILAPICGILNKWSKVNINWKLFVVLSLVLAIILFLSLGGLESVGGRWSRYAGGGSFIGSNPVFSPDGTKVIFSSPSTGHGDIYEMDVDGSNRKQLTESKDYEGEPVYSPDGSQICYVREIRGNSAVYIMDRDGKNQGQLTLSSDLLHCGSCSFSPDNKQVVFNRIRFRHGYRNGIQELCFINTDGSNLRCLTQDYKVEFSKAVFSNDGGSIYYNTCIVDEQPPYGMKAIEIWKRDIATSETQLVSTIPGELYEIKYSPDFKKIVYVAWQGNSQQYQQIYIADIDGSSKMQLTNTKELKSSPSFSYDGSKIIFLSEPEGRGGDIITINSDGSNLKIIGSNK